MRNTLLPLLITVATTVNAQTYFYIDAIQVQPATPTTSDNVSIELAGGLASTGAYIVSSSAQVIGYEVVISIVAADPGGFTVIVPHTETVELGLLQAGTYTISFNAVNVGDFAPEPQHVFEVTGAGASCDSLIIQGVSWHPFLEDALVVSAYHYLLDTLITPSFSLLDMQGDTVAMETTPFPTWAPYQDDPHTLLLEPGISLPDNTVDGVLHFSSSEFTGTACIFNGPFDLCPTASCTDMSPTIQNLGGGITVGTFAWNITDSNGTVVAIGSFELTDTQQADTGAACLPPGTYTLQVVPLDEPTGGQPWVAVSRGLLTGPAQPLSWTDPQPLPFEFYLPCAQIPQGLLESTDPPLIVVNEVSSLQVLRKDGLPIGPVELYDVQGRIMARAYGNTDRLVLPLGDDAAGIFVLRSTAGMHRVVRTR